MYSRCEACQATGQTNVFQVSSTSDDKSEHCVPGVKHVRRQVRPMCFRCQAYQTTSQSKLFQVSSMSDDRQVRANCFRCQACQTTSQSKLFQVSSMPDNKSEQHVSGVKHVRRQVRPMCSRCQACQTRQSNVFQMPSMSDDKSEQRVSGVKRVRRQVRATCFRCQACKTVYRSKVEEVVKSSDLHVYLKPRWKLSPSGHYVPPSLKTLRQTFPTLFASQSCEWTSSSQSFFSTAWHRCSTDILVILLTF